MADNVNITPGSGDVVAADDIAGAKHQRVKLTLGADGVNDGDVSSSNPIPASVSGTVTANAGTGTFAVSAASLPLPSGAATETTLSSINTKTPALGQTTMTGSTPVVIASNQSAVPISGTVAVSSLPSGTTILGGYNYTSGVFLITAAADAATGGKNWLINPVGSGVTVRVRKIRFSSQLGSALVAVTSPRFNIERVTFTGTASGASVAPAKRKSSDAANASSLRTASTGLTLTAGNVVSVFLPVASATAVAYNTPSVVDIEYADDEFIYLDAGEGLVCRQADAGTASDTRRCVIHYVVDEI